MRITGGISTGIDYSLEFAGWEAAVAAGLDLFAWDQGRYPRAFRHRVIAWHNLHRQVEMHMQSAEAEAARRKGKG